MYSKVLVVMLLAVLTASALLTLRQRRIEINHDVAKLHGQIREARYDLWNVQTSIAEHLNPRLMRASIVRAELELEPIVPTTWREPDTTMLAAADDRPAWLASASP